MPRKEQSLVNITPQHKKFVKNLVEGHNIADSARRAGFMSEGYGSYLKRQEPIQNLLHHEMELAGITDGLIAQKMREGLDAMVPPRKDGGKMYEDQFVRKQWADMVLRVRGEYAAQEVNVNKRVINIQMSPDMIKGLIDSDFIDVEALDEPESESVS